MKAVRIGIFKVLKEKADGRWFTVSWAAEQFQLRRDTVSTYLSEWWHDSLVEKESLASINERLMWRFK